MLIKLEIKTLEQCFNLVQSNNKNTKKISFRDVFFVRCYPWTKSKPFSSVFVAKFEDAVIIFN